MRKVKKDDFPDVVVQLLLLDHQLASKLFKVRWEGASAQGPQDIFGDEVIQYTHCILQMKSKLIIIDKNGNFSINILIEVAIT